MSELVKKEWEDDQEVAGAVTFVYDHHGHDHHDHDHHH
jgi:hypothetical protein